MAENVNSTPARSGRGCFGCFFGFTLAVLLLAAVIVAGVVGLVVLFSEYEEDTALPDDPKSFKEEYVCGSKEVSAVKIAVVDVNGVIVSRSGSFSEEAESGAICARIRRAAADPEVAALIVNLNTPGGEVVAADEIYEEIRLFRQKTKKPAVAMMNSMAASGGYYIAAACKPIVANRLTMTGSIGVILSTYNYRGLFDKIGLQAEVYTSGKMKDMLNGARPRTPEEVRVVQELVNNTYNVFVGIVSRSRNIPEAEIRNSVIGNGRVFDGEQALKLKLVDQLGYFRDAAALAAKEAELNGKPYMVIRYQEQFNFIRQMASVLMSRSSIPVNVSLDGKPFHGTFAPKRGMLYFLSADF
ncbi:MAG: signal peptide peptidase SppA [Lentisphaeria bacterium]|nr:signal peptide peptidase SppA [Lentisphaeria bacterium]